MIVGNLFKQSAPIPAGTNANGGSDIEIQLNTGGGGGAPDLKIGVDGRSSGSSSARSASSNAGAHEGTVPYHTHTNGRWTRSPDIGILGKRQTYGKTVAGLAVGACAITSGLAAWEWANPTIKVTKSAAASIMSKAPKEAKVKTPKEAKVKTPKGPVSVAPSFFPSAGPSFFPSAGPSFGPTTCDPNCVGDACTGSTGEFVLQILSLF